MRIGIVTFHWATNYGAILQAFCLQEYLRSQSFKVDIINYKPTIYDISWSSFLKHPSNWLHLSKFPKVKKKEYLLEPFRIKYLNLTKRYLKENELIEIESKYDALISGSDQVLNPFFTSQGEGKPTSTYYLSFVHQDVKRFGYAVSFGCEKYPEYAFDFANQWIKNFDSIGVREKTGLAILKQLGYEGPNMVVPDPTILYGKAFFNNFGINIPCTKESYTCVYMLRRELKFKGDYLYIDELHNPISLDKWLTIIAGAKAMITNSYHGMIVAIFAHVPFVALMEKKKAGMNDRFYTLLEEIGISDRIVFEEEQINQVIDRQICWDEVDIRLERYSKVGKDFLSSILHKIER